MGQKVHPIGFRLGIGKNHQSQWFANPKIYPQLVAEDSFIRKKLLEKFSNSIISNIEIHRKFDNYIQIIIYSSKPGIILSLYKNNLKVLSDFLAEQVLKYRKIISLTFDNQNQTIKSLFTGNLKIVIQIFEQSNPDTNSYFIADFIVEQLQKRVIFRRVLKKALRRAQKARVQGIKIQISGRLNGAEIARREWIREGRVPLQTLRAGIDYYAKKAKTIYGILGVKVWVFKN